MPAFLPWPAACQRSRCTEWFLFLFRGVGILFCFSFSAGLLAFLSRVAGMGIHELPFARGGLVLVNSKLFVLGSIVTGLIQRPSTTHLGKKMGFCGNYETPSVEARFGLTCRAVPVVFW